MEALNHILESQKVLETTFSQKFKELDAAIKTASPHSHPTISSLSKDVGCFKEQMSSMLLLLKQQILAVSETVDAIEMRHRKKFLLFCGIPEVDGEDISVSVVTICQSQLHLRGITRESILVSYRLGVSSNDRPRPVLVRFKDQSMRNTVWSKKKALKGSSVVITEFLTKQRQSIFIDARKHFGMRKVWTLDGNIYVKLPNGKRERLLNDVQLLLLKSQHAAVAVHGSSNSAVSKPSPTAASTSMSTAASKPLSAVASQSSDTAVSKPSSYAERAPLPAPLAAPPTSTASVPKGAAAPAPITVAPVKEPGASKKADDTRRGKRAT